MSARSCAAPPCSAPASCSRTIPSQRTDDRVVEVVVTADDAPLLIGQRVLVKFMKPGETAGAAPRRPDRRPRRPRHARARRRRGRGSGSGGGSRRRLRLFPKPADAPSARAGQVSPPLRMAASAPPSATKPNGATSRPAARSSATIVRGSTAAPSPADAASSTKCRWVRVRVGPSGLGVTRQPSTHSAQPDSVGCAPPAAGPWRGRRTASAGVQTRPIRFSANRSTPAASFRANASR